MREAVEIAEKLEDRELDESLLRRYLEGGQAPRRQGGPRLGALQARLDQRGDRQRPRGGAPQARGRRARRARRRAALPLRGGGARLGPARRSASRRRRSTRSSTSEIRWIATRGSCSSTSIDAPATSTSWCRSSRRSSGTSTIAPSAPSFASSASRSAWRSCASPTRTRPTSCARSSTRIRRRSTAPFSSAPSSSAAGARRISSSSSASSSTPRRIARTPTR